MIEWHEARINGRRSFVAEAVSRRLYVRELATTVQAWVESEKIGNYRNVADAKAACMRRIGLPAPPPSKYCNDPGRYTPQRAERLSRPVTVEELTRPAPVEIPIAFTAAILGFCKCGTRLGRSGKCPALCEPVPQPPPKYTGPKIVGRTHLSRLAAPVYRPPESGWIG